MFECSVWLWTNWLRFRRISQAAGDHKVKVNISEIFFLAVQMSFSNGICCWDYKRSLCSYAGIRCICAASAVRDFRWMCLFCCLSLILLHLCEILRFHFTPGVLDSAVIKSASAGSFSSYLGAYISIQEFFRTLPFVWHWNPRYLLYVLRSVVKSHFYRFTI